MRLPIVDDAARFEAEDFLDDIEVTVRVIFEKAEYDEVLKGNIMEHLSDRCPIFAWDFGVVVKRRQV